MPLQRQRSCSLPMCWRHALAVAVLALQLPTAVGAQIAASRNNPTRLPPPNGYTHVVTAAPGRLVAISGQVALDSKGGLVGKDDARAQAVQVFANLQHALASAGLAWADVIRLDYYLTDINDLGALREVRDRYLPADALPASTLVQVQQLVRPELKVEIAALAVVPQAGSAPQRPHPSTATGQKTRHP